MLYFAVMVNGLSGFMAGAHLFQTSHGHLIVFPIWNVLNSLLLLLMYWVQLIDETAITDDNATPRDVVVSGAVILAVFLICQFLFRLHWSMIFSVCVCYATNVNALLRRLCPHLMKTRSIPKSPSPVPSVVAPLHLTVIVKAWLISAPNAVK